MGCNKNKYFAFKGFTLLELLITLFIISLLSFAGIYYNQTHPNKTKLSLLANQFYFDLSYAKEQAMVQQQMVSICPIDPNQEWKMGYKVQIHAPNDTPSTLLLTRTPPYPKAQLIESHFGLNRSCVYFNAKGQSLFNGHFLYFFEKNSSYVKIILTQTGKIHLEFDDAR